MSEAAVAAEAQRLLKEAREELHKVYRNFYAAERNLEEQTRLTEQARRWAVTLEQDLEQARDESRQVAEDMRL